jgi:SP family general alpha glucoside:H+ symporter-like MFS transporter
VSDSPFYRFSIFDLLGFLPPWGKVLTESAASQSILKQITKAGQLVGLAATGWVVDRIGYKWTMLGALCGIVPIVFMQFFAPNKEVLIAAQFLIGIPLAPFLTLSNVSVDV